MRCVWRCGYVNEPHKQKCHSIGKMSVLVYGAPVPDSIWDTQREVLLYSDIVIEIRKEERGMLKLKEDNVCRVYRTQNNVIY